MQKMHIRNAIFLTTRPGGQNLNAAHEGNEAHPNSSKQKVCDMAAIQTSRSVAPISGRIFVSLRNIVAGIVDWNDSRKTRAALQSLSAHQLEDIGLTLADVDRLTR